jgi:hypothetical protein
MQIEQRSRSSTGHEALVIWRRRGRHNCSPVGHDAQLIDDPASRISVDLLVLHGPVCAVDKLSAEIAKQNSVRRCAFFLCVS